jgi:hypothetical protein
MMGGQTFLAAAGDRSRFTTPEESGAGYTAVCVPPFPPETVHREAT